MHKSVKPIKQTYKSKKKEGKKQERKERPKDCLTFSFSLERVTRKTKHF